MITWRIFEYDGAGFYQAIGSVEAMTHDAASVLAYARFHTLHPLSDPQRCRMAMTRWQRRMLKIDGLMAHAAACERNLTRHGPC